MNRSLFPLARQFRLHHLLSIGVLVLIIAHVVASFWRDWPESASMYLNTTDLATLAGWAGAGLLATVIASSWISWLSWKGWYLVHLLALTHELPHAQYTICGPPAFMRCTRQALRSAGIAGNNIHTEEFQP